MENRVCGSKKKNDKRKAAALWTKHGEGRQRYGSKHRGTLRRSKATSWNKQHLKRQRNNGVALI